MRTIIVVLCVCGLGLVGKAETESQPNIVLFLVDDLGWSDVGYNGSTFYETPNIDRLANEGVRFNQAYAASHVCSPTRASLLTGKNPASIDLTDWLPGRKEFPFQRLKNAEINPHLPFEEITIAEVLKEHGYSTAIFGKWHLGEEPSGPLQHGFDVRVPTDWNKGWPNTGYFHPFGMGGIEGKEGDYLTDRLTDEAIKYIEKSRDAPFFLYLSHYAVHDPIQGRPDLVEKYEKRLRDSPSGKGPPYILEGNPDARDPLSREELDALLDEEDYQDFRIFPDRLVKIKQHQDNPHFAAMVEGMDESLGRVVAKLEELGIADNTIVIFYSDNGGMAGANFGNPRNFVRPHTLDRRFATSNLPLRGAKGWLYEGGIRVPMIVKWPRHSASGVASEIPVTSEDFYPSILEMLDLPLPEEQEIDGMSFVPVLKGNAEKVGGLEGRALYWHFPQYSNHGQQSPGGAIRYGDDKLLEYFENFKVQLFNLKTDPYEKVDVSAAEPEKVRELRGMLHAWRKSVDAKMPTSNPNYDPTLDDQWQKWIQ